MTDGSPAAVVAGAVNRALASEPWARERLAVHAGGRFSIRSGPFGASFEIGAEGTLRAAPADAAPTLALAISPPDLPALAADPARWREFVRGDGDEALESTLRDLAATLPWFVERALAGALGPVIGQRVADAGRAMLAWPGEASRKLAGHAARYASEESNLLARRGETAGTDEALAGIEAGTDALSRRVEALERRVASGARTRLT